jgi:hypothetical protein
MAIRQLPIVGRPTDAPAPLRKIAIEEHFIDPTLVQPNYGDSFSGEFDQQGSSYVTRRRSSACRGNQGQRAACRGRPPRLFAAAGQQAEFKEVQAERVDLSQYAVQRRAIKQPGEYRVRATILRHQRGKH